MSPRVPNPGKKLSDFLPGQHSGRYLYHLSQCHARGLRRRRIPSHQPRRTTCALSSCCSSSGGRLWCATCHNPHEKMSESVEYYRSRCLSCHTTNLPASHPARDSDCLGCHMPRRDAKDGGPFRLYRSSDSAAPRTTARSSLEQRNRCLARTSSRLAEDGILESPILTSVCSVTRRHSSFEGYRDLDRSPATISEMILIFSNGSEKRSFSESKHRMPRSRSSVRLQLDPDSALTEASAASPYIQEGDDARAIAHLERADSASIPCFCPQPAH